MDPCKRVVVLGANSFSGQDFIDLLLDDPATEVLGISRSQERSPLFLRYLARERSDLSRYCYHSLDLNRDLETVQALVDDFRPDCIVNFAAQSESGPSWARPEEWLQTNVVALSRLLTHLVTQDYVKRFIQFSSASVYGSPTEPIDESAALAPDSPFAASKAAADLLLGTYNSQVGFPTLVVRSTPIYGARQLLHKLVPRSVIAIRKQETLSLQGGESVFRAFLNVRDVSRGVLAALERGQVGEVYNLSPERVISIRDLIARLCDVMNASFYDLAEDQEATDSDADTTCAVDSSRARTELGWAPTLSLDEGLDEVAQWAEENWAVIQRLPCEYVHQA